jgi:uncharacterized membrane protein YfcA
MTAGHLAALILSGAIGVSLGLLGGGGSILAVPVLVYVAGVDARDSVVMSLGIVGSTSFVGSLLHARHARLDLRVALLFGGTGMAGAYLGSRFTRLVSGPTLLLLFALLMLLVATLMLTRKARPEDDVPRAGRLPHTLAAGLLVGVLTGFLGVGGGFLIVPALVLFAGLPMRMAVGTSLLVIAANCVAGILGHLEHGIPEPLLMASFTAVAVLGSLVGVAIAGRVSQASLRRAFAVFVVLVALGMLGANVRQVMAAPADESAPSSPQ